MRKKQKNIQKEQKTEKELEILNTVQCKGVEFLSFGERDLFNGIQDRKRAREQGFKDGVEFGYNKGYHDAEEHYMNVIDSQHELVDESKKENFKNCMKCTDNTYQYGFKDGYNKAKQGEKR